VSDILAIDVGTTVFKMGVFTSKLEKKCESSRSYQVNIYDEVKTDIEPEKWWQALRDCCTEQRKFLSSVGVISFSVTTPSLVPMAEDGTALGPSILFLDGRSHQQAKEIRERVGEETFLRETSNLPVSGGASICSILWIRKNQPEIWAATAKFGSANTYMIKRLTDQWAVDPSTQSFSGLYNTARNDLTWNKDILALSEIPEAKLPPLLQSYHKAGEILPEVARELRLPKYCNVLCGGNDALLGALAGGLTSPGDIHNVCGTGEGTLVCIGVPVSSRSFNLRCHVIPNLWIIMFMLQTGGKAYEWFHSVFCQDMTKDQFFNDYIPFVLDSFFGSEDLDSLEASLPEYVPFLQGSRYTTEQLTASFSGLKLETTREKILLSLIRGNAVYQGQFLREVASLVKLGPKVMVTGGGAKIRGILRAKKRWTGDFEYQYQDQSALLGAAILGQFYQTKRYP
jgi:sugar (pentulose or hexulose) kinase